MLECFLETKIGEFVQFSLTLSCVRVTKMGGADAVDRKGWT